MNDLDICKRIAEIEGATETFAPNIHGAGSPLIAVFDNKTCFDYNPLTDDALCFKLMVNYKVRFCPEYDGSFVAFLHNGHNEYARILDKNPNRAICLAIIEAHK